jgi:hypothetical protein
VIRRPEIGWVRTETQRSRFLVESSSKWTSILRLAKPTATRWEVRVGGCSLAFVRSMSSCRGTTKRCRRRTRVIQNSASERLLITNSGRRAQRRV